MSMGIAEHVYRVQIQVHIVDINSPIFIQTLRFRTPERIGSKFYCFERTFGWMNSSKRNPPTNALAVHLQSNIILDTQFELFGCQCSPMMISTTFSVFGHKALQMEKSMHRKS